MKAKFDDDDEDKDDEEEDDEDNDNEEEDSDTLLGEAIGGGALLDEDAEGVVTVAEAALDLAAEELAKDIEAFKGVEVVGALEELLGSIAAPFGALARALALLEELFGNASSEELLLTCSGKQGSKHMVQMS